MMAMWPPILIACDALLDGAGAAHLHDEVRAAPAGRLAHRLGPLRLGLVVDALGGAHAGGARQLLIR